MNNSGVHPIRTDVLDRFRECQSVMIVKSKNDISSHPQSGRCKRPLSNVPLHMPKVIGQSTNKNTVEIIHFLTMDIRTRQWLEHFGWLGAKSITTVRLKPQGPVKLSLYPLTWKLWEATRELQLDGDIIKQSETGTQSKKSSEIKSDIWKRRGT